MCDRTEVSFIMGSVAGFLPAPAAKLNRGAADILEGNLFAYGACSCVVIVEVRRIKANPPLILWHQGKGRGDQ